MKHQRRDEIIDFDTMGMTMNEDAEKARIRDRLYELKNPYVGNKRGIIVDIADALDKHGVDYRSVLDLFSGSGVVSLFMKLKGKEVLSNDLLTSSYYNALCFVENNNLRLTVEDVDFLCNNNNPGRGNFVQQRYSGKRFTDREAIFLDNYRANIPNLIARRFDKTLEECESVDGPNQAGVLRDMDIMRGLCFVMINHYVINRCFLGGRLNNGQILAKLDHRLQHQRNATLDKGVDEMKFRLSPPLLFRTDDPGDCRATNLDACDALRKLDRHIGLLYLDPPYGGDQSDYAHMFSFCEEYVHGKPMDEMSHLTTAKKFSASKSYEDNFADLLEHAKFIKTWAISYNDSSWADIEKIEGMVKKHKNDVVVVNISHEYRYRDRSKDEDGNSKAKGVEYLVIAR